MSWKLTVGGKAGVVRGVGGCRVGRACICVVWVPIGRPGNVLGVAVVKVGEARDWHVELACIEVPVACSVKGRRGEGEGALGTERHGGGGGARMCVPCTVKVVLCACAQQRAGEGLVVWGVGVQAALQAVNEARARV